MAAVLNPHTSACRLSATKHQSCHVQNHQLQIRLSSICRISSRAKLHRHLGLLRPARPLSQKLASTDVTFPSASTVPPSPRALQVTDFAVKFASASEVYEVHSWHLVMGLLQVKDGIAAEILKEQGLTNFQEAFLEVMYCLKMADSLQMKAFQGQVNLTNRAMHVVKHARWTAKCLGHQQLDTEHILAALAFYEVIQDLFPDLDLTEDTLWAKINDKWAAKGLPTNKKLLREQAQMFERTFKESPQNRYAFPSLKKFEHLGVFSS